jgi:hypothetical protein
MTGVKILESNVELINPPIRTMANGDISGLVERAIGIRPPIAVNEVRIMGKNRISPASLIAMSKGFPSSLN